ncbi:hypothetical protein AAFF_G00158110 [Aldrovandia affinis]|uniref:Reticulon n=1 Tax=Aldrovandia affinis TaxID=143900 RepID=A0AAD7W8G8_9TELE|nr:hypothetical protein AAFF_G00158110 [Aldrovandia affinis]
MDEHISSTTVSADDELDKLQAESGVGSAAKPVDTEFPEDNEAVAKPLVDEEGVLDSTAGAHAAINGLKAEEEPPRKVFSESASSGPEPPLATQPTDSAVAESTEEHTEAQEIEDKIVEPEAEDVIVKPTTPPPTEETVLAPETEETEETALAPETEDTIVQPETEDLFVKPEAPVEAPTSLEKESDSEASLVDLLYWRDIKVTGVVFGASLFLLLSLTVCSIVSVCSYVALALLSVTVAFRIYKGILQAVQKSDEGHPFKAYLDQDVSLSEDSVHKYSDMALERLNVAVKELRRLFLVDDLVDSLKFAVGMWVLTYVGALFNGLTILILGLIGLFSCPVIYEKNQAQIDHYVALVNKQFKDVVGKVQAKVPGLKPKTE